MRVEQVIRWDTYRQINVKLGYLYPGLGYSKKAINKVIDMWWAKFEPTLALSYRQQLARSVAMPVSNFRELQVVIKYLYFEGLTETQMLEKIKLMLER